MNLPSDFKVLYTKKKIEERVCALANSISGDYEGKSPVLLGVLNGSFVFVADLIRHLRVNAQTEFIRVSSYGNATKSSGDVCITLDLPSSIAERDVIVIEDIVDTGQTLNRLLGCLRDAGVASLKVCVLLDKQVKRTIPIEIDYLGMSVPDKFIVGYGLDYKGLYRGLSQLYIM